MDKPKTALITGSTRGIGLAIAEHFAAQGFQIALNGSREVPQELIQEIKNNYQIPVIGVSGNIAEADDCKRIIAEVIEAFGTLDILVNNAGITRDKLMLRMTTEDFQSVLDINLTGTFNMIRSALKPMIKQRAGRIINLSSVSGVSGNAGQSNYAASKAGVIGLTKSVAREVAKCGITCNAIAPGFIDTKMTQKLSEKVKEQLKQQIPLQSFGTPQDVAKTALYLADSPYVTGQVLCVDGGLVM